VIIRLDSTNVRLRWTAVTEDTSGNPLTINYYRIHRSTDPHFVPSPADSIGMTTGMSYDDSDVMWPNEKYFYSVIAVDTDGVVASAPNPPTPRIIATSPTRDDSPRAIREQHQK
jgi:fibronectin type 3 domain-containing protein